MQGGDEESEKLFSDWLGTFFQEMDCMGKMDVREVYDIDDVFLNKVDKKKKIALFQLLENAPMLTESKETVMQELELSEFIVNKTVAELNADFIEFGLSEDFQIVSDGIFLNS